MGAPRETGSNDALLMRTGRRAWAALGVAGVLVLLFLLLRQVSILAAALVVAAFPAAVLSPASTWLKRKGAPGAVASLALILATAGVIGLALWFVVPQFLDQLPALAESIEDAFADLEEFLADSPVPLPFDIGEGGLSAAVQQAVDSFDGGATGVVGQGLDLLQRVVDFGTALLIFLVALFFYLRDGDRIWAGVTSLLPRTARRHVRQVSGQLWWTVGAYFRAQVLVALVDAVAIGIGLVLLGVPLAFPLALLVFFGGFFPIVGAFASGLLAVLVALADQGLGTALLVLGLVVLVQQAEGNLLEPLIISPVLRLHPFAIILAVTAGAVTFGILGAFLAVPVAACFGRVVDYVRGRRPAAGPGSDPDDDEPAWADPTGEEDGHQDEGHRDDGPQVDGHRDDGHRDDAAASTGDTGRGATRATGGTRPASDRHRPPDG
ncbi:AI-2E family transporter [Trujillonella humicola]|uniref:AI-2E family transporter n=1 Tax=Trujillonella humicola TaxID=3383699 RepID=UPI003906449D